MKTNKNKFIVIVASQFLPVLCFAAGSPQNFGELVSVYVLPILLLIPPILASLSLTVFFWGLADMILWGGGNEEKLKKGKLLMFWGSIALFTMISIWGIVSFLVGDLGLKGVGNTIIIPQLPTK